jgi:hypothetical protein
LHGSPESEILCHQVVHLLHMTPRSSWLVFKISDFG